MATIEPDADPADALHGTAGHEAAGTPAPGWYRDPRVPFQLRWWTGDDWSTNVYMPDRHQKPTPEELIPELALHDGKWEWPQS